MATENFTFSKTFSKNPESLAAVWIAAPSTARFPSKAPSRADSAAVFPCNGTESGGKNKTTQSNVYLQAVGVNDSRLSFYQESGFYA